MIFLASSGFFTPLSSACLAASLASGCGLACQQDPGEVEVRLAVRRQRSGLLVGVDRRAGLAAEIVRLAEGQVRLGGRASLSMPFCRPSSITDRLLSLHRCSGRSRRAGGIPCSRSAGRWRGASRAARGLVRCRLLVDGGQVGRAPRSSAAAFLIFAASGRQLRLSTAVCHSASAARRWPACDRRRRVALQAVQDVALDDQVLGLLALGLGQELVERRERLGVLVFLQSAAGRASASRRSGRCCPGR